MCKATRGHKEVNMSEVHNPRLVRERLVFHDV